MDNSKAAKLIREHNEIHQRKEPGALYITEALDMAADALEQIIVLREQLDAAMTQLKEEGDGSVYAHLSCNSSSPPCFGCGANGVDNWLWRGAYSPAL